MVYILSMAPQSTVRGRWLNLHIIGNETAQAWEILHPKTLYAQKTSAGVMSDVSVREPL